MSTLTYNKLLQIIESYNKSYEEHLYKLIDARKLTSKQAIQTAKHNLWQLVHDYATDVSNELLRSPETLSIEDLDLLDLVNPRAWKEMEHMIPEKVKIIITMIRNQDADHLPKPFQL